MKPGTFTSFDYPSSKQEEAFKFLKKEFENIGAIVRKEISGEYISFEIDLPAEFGGDRLSDEESNKDFMFWCRKAELIEEEYLNRFE